MSNVVDSRVVEMKFDNKDFERNVQTSMSTLDKLKKALNLDGASKGLETVASAAKNFDTSGMVKSISAVETRFSALQVAGVTAIANITNDIVNMGKRLAAEFTTIPVKTGFEEFELKMGSVQTIMASTGASLEEVNGYLNELNTYSDKTIYSFKDMTSNIGKFTNAGVNLKDAVAAIQGISNEAAVSGANATEASHAMYNFAQALSAGYVKLIDWKSIEVANMATVEFKQQLLGTAEALGTVVKVGDQYKTTTTNAKGQVSDLFDATHNFNDALNNQWMTTEVLTQTLAKYSDETTDIGKKAFAAAQDVKTFSMMMDTLKEAAQSGWAQTWELVVGDFEQGKQLWTYFSNMFSDIIGKSADARNNFLSDALSSKWSKVTDLIEDAGMKTADFEDKFKKFAEARGIHVDKLISRYGSLERAFEFSDKLRGSVKDFFKSAVSGESATTESTKGVTKSLEEFQKVVNQVIRGNYGSGKKRVEALTKAGWDYATVQGLVNKVWKRNGKTWKDTTITAEDLTAAIGDISTEEIKSIGYTEEQADALKQLAKQAEESGTPINELLQELDKPSGRWLLIDSIKNIIYGIVHSIEEVKGAWSDMFPSNPEGLYNLIYSFHEVTKVMHISADNADKLRRTFRGLFAIVNLVTTFFGGGVKFALTLLNKLLSKFDLNILDVTASFGDMLVALNDFILNNKYVDKGFELLASGIKKAIEMFGQFVDFLYSIPQVKEFVDSLKDVDLEEVGRNIIQGLENGLKDGIHSVPDMLAQIGLELLASIKGVLGIHSPSTEMEAVGKFTIEGFLNGLKEGAEGVLTFLGSFAGKCLDTLGKLDWSKIFAGGLSVGLILLVRRMIGILDKFAGPAEGFGKMLGGTGDVLTSFSEVLADSGKNISKVIKSTTKVVKSFAKLLSANAFKKKAEGLKDIAIAFGIMAASIYVIAKIDPDRLWPAVGVIAAMAGIMLALTLAMDKFSSVSVSVDKKAKKLNFNGLKTGILSISLALLSMATVVRILGTMDENQLGQGLAALTGISVLIAGILFVYGSLVKGKSAQNIDKAGKMIKRMATSMLLMVAVVKLAGMLEPDELKQGGAFVAAFLVFIAVLSKITQHTGKGIDKLGGMMVKMALALGLMVGVCKLVGRLSADEMIKGGLFAAAFVIFIRALVKASTVDKDNKVLALGKTLLAISTAMLLMVGVCKLVGMLSVEDMLKGAMFAAGYVVFVKALVKAITIGSEEQIGKVAGTLLAMSLAIGVMAGVCVLLSLIDTKSLAKGVVAVGFLGLIMSGMMMASKNVPSDGMRTLIAMSVAIGIMAASVAALSFIKPEKLAAAVIALSAVMGMFAVMEKASKDASKSFGSLIVMTVAIGMMAAAIAIVAQLPVKNALASATALSIVMLAFAGAMKIMGGIQGVSVKAIASAAAMLVIMGFLTLIIKQVADLPAKQTISNVAALSMLLISLSACCAILAVSTKGITIKGALTGIGMMLALVLAMGGLIAGLGALNGETGKVEKFLDQGLPVLEKIGKGIGSFVGSILSGFEETALAGLPTMGEQLASFMENISSVKPEAVESAKALAEAMVIITGADILTGIMNFLTGGVTSFSDFSTALGEFGSGMNAFATNLGDIDVDKVKSAAEAAKILAEMSTMINSEGGWLSKIVGDKDIGKFGSKLGAFGSGLKAFATNVDGITKEGVSGAIEAGKELISMSNSLSGEGGWISSLIGDKDIASFGSKLGTFGQGIKNFATNSNGVTKDSVSGAIEAGKELIGLSNSLTGEGGWISKIIGDKDVESFGKKLGSFGQGIKTFAEKVADVESSDVAKGVSAASNLIDLANQVPEGGGKLAEWFGDNDLGTFAENVQKFGAGIKSFDEQVKGITVTTIASSVEAAQRLATVAKIVDSMDTLGIAQFTEVETIGESLRNYVDTIDNIGFDNIEGSCTAVDKLVSLVKKMTGIDSSGVSQFAKSINALSKTDFGGLKNAFSGTSDDLSSTGSKMIGSLASGIQSQSSKVSNATSNMMNQIASTLNSGSSQFQSTGTKLGEAIAKGITSSTQKSTKTVKSMVVAASEAARSYYQSFYRAGGYLVTGFANGINDNQYKAKAKAQAMAKAAKTAAEKELDINSPSKEFYRIGDYAGQGFVNALGTYEKKSYKVSTSVAQAAKSGIAGSIKMLSSLISNGMDSEPTIRPVVDLSDVKAGAALASSLFNTPQSMSLTMGNVSAIRSSFDLRQNGSSNDDVVSAINGLRKDLANAGGDTYNVDGITYDDGSNIASAVRTLTSAARMERRK